MSAKEQYLLLQNRLPVFLRSWWLDAVCSGSWDVVLLHQENEIVAVWPYAVEYKAGIRLIRTPILTPYLGPFWIAGKPRPANWIAQIKSKLPANGYLQFTGFPGFDRDEWVSLGMQYKEKVTYLLHLDETGEALWANVHSKRRNDIRKAQEDLLVKQGSIDIERFVLWHRTSFEEKGKAYPYSGEIFHTVIEASERAQAAVAYSASDKEGKLLAQAWFVYDNSHMYCLLTATPAQTHRGAVALLIWTAIQQAKRMGLSVFDFEGSMDPGIARFFERFGGRKEWYPECAHTSSFLWKLKQKLMG